MLDLVKEYISLQSNLTQDLLPKETITRVGRSPLVSVSIKKKRTAIEVTIARGFEVREAIVAGLTVYNSWRTDLSRRVPDSGSPISFAKTLTLSNTDPDYLASKKRTQQQHEETIRLWDQAQTQRVETSVADGHDEIDVRDAEHRILNSHVLICKLDECERPAVDGYQFCCRRHAYQGRSPEEPHPNTRVVRHVFAPCVDSILRLSIRVIFDGGHAVSLKRFTFGILSRSPVRT